MLYDKKGMPDEGQIVLCTVTKIHYHSVFASLDEYQGKQGMIHISEISPGRIRNINDYVQEGKKIVCKILKIKRDRGHIDLSLRRVSQAQRRGKIESIKQEQKSEKIIEFVANQHKLSKMDLFKKIEKYIFDNYDSIHESFDAIVNGDSEIADFGLDADLSKTLEEIIRQRIKPPKMVISSELSLVSYEPEGVEIVKECLAEVLKKYDDLDIFYSGGGKFSMKIVRDDFKTAEAVLKDTTDMMQKFMEKKNSEFSYTREEGKKTTE